MARHDRLTLSLFDFDPGPGLALDSAFGQGMPAADPAPTDTPAEAGDFRLTGGRQLASGWRCRAEATVAAIRLAKQIIAEGRPATAEEQAQLARFTGFGASELAQNLFRRPGERFKAGWEALGQELEQLVGDADLASLARSTQYAHYTPERLIRAMWQAACQLGFRGGAVLEPGCGIGLVMAGAPDELRAEIDGVGIEAEPVSAMIARLLLPSADIRCGDFTRARLPERFDLAIGNVPFSDRKVRSDHPAGRLGLSLHDFFIARSLERLRPGGLLVVLTSRWTLDKTDPIARQHMASLAELVAAFRLPEGALREAAGTDVCVDLLLMRRHEREPVAGDAWEGLDDVLPAEGDAPTLAINRYLATRPDRVLGRHARTTGPYGPAYGCIGDTGEALARTLEQQIAGLPPGPPMAGRRLSQDGRAAADLAIGTAADGATLKEGSYLTGAGGRLERIVAGQPVPVPLRAGRSGEGISAKHARLIRALLPIRDAVGAILRAQAADAPWAVHQTRLRVAHSAFTSQFGPINRTVTTVTRHATAGGPVTVQHRPNLQPFMDDPDCWLVASIERYDPETGEAERGAIFTSRVIHPPAEPVVRSAADALAVTLEETGQVDLARIGELLGSDHEAVLAELGASVFLDPDSGSWQTADAYLSGPVRVKLAAAEAAALHEPTLQRNVDALQRVQPADLRPSEITARLGSPWIPAEDVTAFVREVLGIDTHIWHTPEIASWSVLQRPFEGAANATSVWGTSRRHAGLLLDDALHQATPQVWDSWIEDGKERRELNVEATEAAKERLEKIKAAFERWVWTDVARADRLSRIYNDRYNNLVVRHFDGSHLRLPGASNAVQLYPHQKRVIWRIITSGSTCIAHCVGAGKTYAMAAAVMEQKRLGLITKAMMVVPGHCLAQAAREFLLLYPEAGILVADEESFASRQRHRFLARAATDSWDAIIITNSAFKLIATPAEFERTMIQDALASYEELLSRSDQEDRLTRKRIERLKEGLEAKLLALQSRKDDMLTMAELGIDQLIVDEAQYFRKLSFATNMTALKGVDPDGSQRAWDLYVKARYIAHHHSPSRALVLASGTPVTNTMGELYTLQRLLAPDALAARGIQAFDAWAAVFGATRTQLELQPSGKYKPVTRFSEFVNVPELIAMFRTFADIVTQQDLAELLQLPRVRGGKRQIVTAKPSPAFRAYQEKLDARIKLIEERKGAPQPGDDILLSVITDGRHAAIDLRLVEPDASDEQGNKLNLLIHNVGRIWRQTAGDRYTDASGRPYPFTGAGQLVFSDLGTLAVEQRRGFSAYRWIKDQLVRQGVPPAEIAFMQDFTKSETKARLLADVNAGRVRILIGSSQTMGTGVNVQRRLKALHHLDVPWLPSDIEQREGRIVRQGNAHEEVEIYAYATLGSLDAPLWQANERKARFIAAALAGDPTLRRLEDTGSSQADQFALAKAIASGDARLMQKAGLEAELARLRRLRAAHQDEQLAIRREIRWAEGTVTRTTQRIAHIEADLERREPTRGDRFRMTVDGRAFGDRKAAGQALLMALRRHEKHGAAEPVPVGAIGGFELQVRSMSESKKRTVELALQRSGWAHVIRVEPDLTPLGLCARLEHELDRFGIELAEARRRLCGAQRQAADYGTRIGQGFELDDELLAKEAELEALDTSLAGHDRTRLAA